MAQNSSPNYKELYLKSQESTRQTTFLEFLKTCHELFSRPLQVRSLSRSTKGTIPPPKGKYCPTQLLPWSDCAAVQQEIYDSVCHHLQATNEHPLRLFSNIARLEGIADALNTTIHSERNLETYEELAVENHVRNIIFELRKLPAARQQFQLGDGISFESHTNDLEVDTENRSSERPRPDQFCIHRVDGVNTLLLTMEYKPPHKLTVENLRVGLRPLDFWNDMVQRTLIPTDKAEKLKYNAEQIVGAVLTQEYHVMICEGLEYSYVTVGLALVLLRIPQDDPGTLLYFLCEPNMEVHDSQSYQQPKTAIARVLCLTLMSSLSSVRDHAWRMRAKDQLHKWATSFALVRSQIPDSELTEAPPDSEFTDHEYTSSEFLPSSSPMPSPSPQVRPSRRPGCAPSQNPNHPPDSESSDSESNQAAPRRKRNLSQITSSPPQPPSQPRNFRHNQGDRFRQRRPMQFCTQRCLLGLQRHDTFDELCPNLMLHQRGQTIERHPIGPEELIRQLKQQLDEDIDQYCTPLHKCGAYGACFKITFAPFGYTMVGKGTTTHLWSEVSREVEVYRVLQKAQGSAIPVFLGPMDLNMSYYLHGAGEIQHMLVMAWGGEPINSIEQPPDLKRQIRRSRKEVHSLGVMHGDLRSDNLLWNAELQRVLIIDFHRSTLNHEFKRRQVGSKRNLEGGLSPPPKRFQIAL